MPPRRFAESNNSGHIANGLSPEEQLTITQPDRCALVGVEDLLHHRPPLAVLTGLQRNLARLA